MKKYSILTKVTKEIEMWYAAAGACISDSIIIKQAQPAVNALSATNDVHLMAAVAMSGISPYAPASTLTKIKEEYYPC